MLFRSLVFEAATGHRSRIWRQACCNRWRLTGRLRYDPVAECVAARLSDPGSGPLVRRASSRIARGTGNRRERRDHRRCYSRQHSQVHGGLRCLCSWAKAIDVLNTQQGYSAPTHTTHNPEGRQKQNCGDNRHDGLLTLVLNRAVCALLLHRVAPRFKARNARLLERRPPSLLLL